MNGIKTRRGGSEGNRHDLAAGVFAAYHTVYQRYTGCLPTVYPVVSGPVSGIPTGLTCDGPWRVNPYRDMGGREMTALKAWARRTQLAPLSSIAATAGKAQCAAGTEYERC